VTIEDTIAEAVKAALAPLQAEVHRMVRLQEALLQRAPPVLVSVAEAAKHLGVSLKTARRRVKSGEIPVKRSGRRVLVDLAALHPPTDAAVSAAAHTLKLIE